MALPSLDRLTLEFQIQILAANHADLIKSLQAREGQLKAVQDEIEQYKGALAYSKHIQEQTRKSLEPLLAADLAAKLAAESAAKSTGETPPSSP